MSTPSISIPSEVQTLLDQQVPVVVGLSGGKDSQAVAWAVAQHLTDYPGRKLMIHADLGMVEWEDSWPACQRIAEACGWELVSCTRPSGGMMERWEGRWTANMKRYQELSCVKLILPWSTPALRFCQSELKVDPITAAIKRTFGKVPVLNVTGVRAEESTQRAKQPVCSPVPKLPPGSLSWRPIHHWKLADVWDAIADSGVAAHVAYLLHGSTRVSCRWCILASEADLQASLRDEAGHPVYIRMCDLELDSGFSFQGKWLTSLRPDLVRDGGQRLFLAMRLAQARKAIEEWLPKHLQFTKGWPHCLPTQEEAEGIARMRSQIAALYPWGDQVRHTTASSVLERYAFLLEAKEKKSKCPRRKKSTAKTKRG